VESKSSVFDQDQFQSDKIFFHNQRIDLMRIVLKSGAATGQKSVCDTYRLAAQKRLVGVMFSAKPTMWQVHT
jgi:hypothetical protein